jgi:hypothetical protein
VPSPIPLVTEWTDLSFTYTGVKIESCGGQQHARTAYSLNGYTIVYGYSRYTYTNFYLGQAVLTCTPWDRWTSQYRSGKEVS